MDSFNKLPLRFQWAESVVGTGKSQRCPSLYITNMLSYPQLSFHDNVEHWRKLEECCWTKGRGGKCARLCVTKCKSVSPTHSEAKQTERLEFGPEKGLLWEPCKEVGRSCPEKPGAP